MERPNFESVSITVVRCDMNPDDCVFRHLSVSDGITNFYCWHPKSPEPDHEFSDGIYRQCATKNKKTDAKA